MPRLTPDWAAPRAVHLTSILAAGRGALLGLRADCTPRSTCGSRCLANAAPTDTSVGPRSRRADARQMEPSVRPAPFLLVHSVVRLSHQLPNRGRTPGIEARNTHAPGSALPRPTCLPTPQSF